MGRRFVGCSCRSGQPLRGAARPQIGPLRERDPDGCYRAHLKTFVRYPSARSRGQPALYPGLFGARHSGYHHHLYSSHTAIGSAGSGSDQQAGGSLVGIELADVFRLRGPAYRQKYAGHIPIHHLQAMQDIETCRTEALGGQVYVSPDCEQVQYSYHSCRNRHCPKCQNEQAQA